MNLELAEYVVMPNHFHGIINIGYNKFNTAIYENNTRRDAMLCASELDHNSNDDFNGNPKNKFGPQYKNLASIIRGFKAAVTTCARKNNVRFDWQARFHDLLLLLIRNIVALPIILFAILKIGMKINFI